jgi:TRAP-type transport system small permease protein
MNSLSESRLVHVVGAIQDKLMLVLLAIIPFLIVAQVVLRYVFNAPLMGIEEILLFPAVWLYFLGGSAASKERNHIDCGILVLYIKKDRSLALFRIVRMGLSVLVGCWTSYWAFWFFSYSLSKWKLSDLLYLPMFLGESAIFIGLLLMTIFSLVELIDRLNEFRHVSGLKA